jgi:outer membrane lipoprotein-sorting protein
MQKFALLFSVFTALFLTSSVAAEPALDALRQKASEHETYAMTLEGSDENGKYTAVYFYSPELSVLTRMDREGKTLFLYDREKRADKVQVTRQGVAYMYRLDNPRLPANFPGSLLSAYLESATGRGQEQATDEGNALLFETDKGDTLTFVFKSPGEFERLDVVRVGDKAQTLSVTQLEFDPEPDHPDLASIGRYIRKR